MFIASVPDLRPLIYIPNSMDTFEVEQPYQPFSRLKNWN